MSGGSTTTSSGSQQSINQIPQWMQDAGQRNYAFAEQVAAQPLQQYQGQLVPGVAPQTQQAWDLAAGSQGAGTGQYNAGTAGYLGALGQAPSTVTPQSLAKTDLSPYENPYTQDVINKTLPIMQQALGQQQTQLGGNATQNNAFGGSRFGVAQGVLGAQGALSQEQMAAQLNQANFNQAQAAATGDITRDLQAQTSNQGAKQAKINSDILASQGLTNTGDALNKSLLAQYGLLTSAGAGQSAQAQNEIGASQAKFNEARAYPNLQLNTLLSGLTMTPHDTAQTGTSSQSQTTPTDWLGVATDMLGNAANVGKLAMTSDKAVKKNITPMGSDPMTGVPIKSFRFKGQPPTAPKTVGPLAQDVEQAAPGSTARIGGILSVPRGTLAAATPSVAARPNFTTRMPNPSATTNPRAGAKGVRGALANTPRRAARVMGGLG